MFPQEFYQQVVVTPLIRYQGLNTSWREIWMKDETKQITHSFKFRGNFFRLLEAPPNSTVVTASTGNHALGMATAAKILCLRAQVFVPATISQLKVQAITDLGAKVVVVDGDFDACKCEAEKCSATTGAPYISGFDDLSIIRGHSSLFYEIHDQYPQGFDVVFVPVGGGGLLAGCLQYYQGTKTKVVGVELDSVPSMKVALAAGKQVTLPPATTRTEGLLVRTAGIVPFQIAQQAEHLEIVLVSDALIQRTIRLLWECNSIRAEGAGAAALTAALHYQQASWDQRVMVVVSGGNIDEKHFQEALYGEMVEIYKTAPFGGRDVLRS